MRYLTTLGLTRPVAALDTIAPQDHVAMVGRQAPARMPGRDRPRGPKSRRHESVTPTFCFGKIAIQGLVYQAPSGISLQLSSVALGDKLSIRRPEFANALYER